MRLSSRFTRSVLTTVLLSLGTYLLASGDVGLGLLVVPLFLLGWGVTGGEDSPRLPRGLMLAMSGVALAFLLVSLAAREIDIEVLSRFIAVLVVVKAFDRRLPRDHAQLLALSLFLVLGGVSLNVSLLPGALALLFAPSLVMSVLLYQIEAGLHMQRTAEGRARPSGDERAGFGRALMALGVSAGVVACLIASVVFVLVPRGIGPGGVGETLQVPRTGAVVGFSEQVDLGLGGAIETDDSIVLDVRPLAELSETFGIAPPILYLRGAVLEDYSSSSGQWSSRVGEGVSGTMDTRGWVRVQGRPDENDEQFEITIRNAPNGRAVLFLPERTVAFQPAFVGDSRVLPGEGLARVRDWQGGRMRYTVRLAQPGLPEPTTGRTPVDSSVVDPSVSGLARQVLTAAGVEPDPAVREVERDLAAAQALRRYLMGRHEYSLDRPRIPEGRDPIAWFLENGAAGHCEFFAGSLVEMCRAVGVNARVVTGYVAAEFNPSSSAYVVRLSNAHAWAEIERSAGVWHPLDPTPSVDLHEIHQPPTNAMHRARQLLDLFDQFWVSSIVAFDAHQRRKLLGIESSQPSSTGSVLLDQLAYRLAFARFGDVSRAVGMGLLAGSVTAGAGFGLLWLLRKRRRKIEGPAVRYFWQSWSDRDSRRLHAALLRCFERRGVPKPETRPLLRHASESAFADLTGPAESLCASRFGGQDRSAEIRSAIDRLS